MDFFIKIYRLFSGQPYCFWPIPLSPLTMRTIYQPAISKSTFFALCQRFFAPY